MTISVANTANTNTVQFWRLRTNEIADALSNKVVTVDSNTTNGNAAVNGYFSSTVLVANTIRGGTAALAGNLSVTSNVTFTGAKTNLGLGANVSLSVGNATHRVLVSNNTDNSLLATKIALQLDLADVTVSGLGNNFTLVYSSGSNSFVVTNVATLSVATANNATNFGGQPNSFYTNASNMATGTLSAARLTGAYGNVTGLGLLTGLSVNASSANLSSGGNVALNVSAANGSVKSIFLQSNGANLWELSSNTTDVLEIKAWASGSTNATLVSLTNTGLMTAARLTTTSNVAVGNGVAVYASATGQSSLTISSNGSTSNAALTLQANGTTHFQVHNSPSSNALLVSRYNNSGVLLDTPLTVSRTTGVVTVSNAVIGELRDVAVANASYVAGGHTSTQVIGLDYVGSAGVVPLLQSIGNQSAPGHIGAFHFSSVAGDAGVMYFGRSKASAKGSHTAVTTGDDLGVMAFAGSDGSNFVTSAFILSEVDAAVSTNIIPGRVRINVANTAGGLQEAVRWSSDLSTGFNGQVAVRVTRSTAGTGSTISFDKSTFVVLDKGAGTAAITLALPTSPKDGTWIEFWTRSAITTLTIDAGSSTKYNFPSTCSAASGLRAFYSSDADAWFAQVT